MADYVPSALFWFTVAFVNAGLAEQKRRSRWNWFVISVFLGPIATAMIVMWAPLEAPRALDGASESDPAAQK